MNTMPEYLAILLGPFRDHPLAGKVLADEPAMATMFSRLFEREHDYSSSERAVLNLALALWNSNRDFRVADIGRLDSANRALAVAAISARYNHP